jgi:hypothetical protein
MEVVPPLQVERLLAKPIGSVLQNIASGAVFRLPEAMCLTQDLSAICGSFIGA